MKNRLLRNAIITGALCTILVVPSFAQEANVSPVSAKDLEAIPISHRISHWSETHIDQLSEHFDIKPVFGSKNLNSPITQDDFKSLIRLVIDQEYDNAPDAMTREAVVYELTRIWAEKTGKDLDEIVVIAMLIYSDTDEIDIKYKHGITVAYMNDIAKGRGAGIFDPKADITYGEFAALLNNTYKAIEKELKPIEQPVEEGRFETKGSYTIEDDKVVFDFELMNHYTEPKTLKFGSGQQFELTITDEEGTEVYRYSDGKFFTMALIFKDINPGESLKWQDAWDMTNKEGEKLTSGKYRAEIKIMVITEEGDEKIDESQLTAAIDFEL